MASGARCRLGPARWGGVVLSRSSFVSLFIGMRSESERASERPCTGIETHAPNERTDENRLLSPSLSALPHPRSGLRLRLISSRLVRLALAPRSKRFNLEHAVEPRGSAETEPQHPQSFSLFSFSLYLVANYIVRRSRNDITIIAGINIVAPRYDEIMTTDVRWKIWEACECWFHS